MHQPPVTAHSSLSPATSVLTSPFRPTGKSSLVISFIDNNFVESYYPTIESTFSKSINHKGTEYECDIIDTAGQVSFNYPPTPPSCTPR